MHFDYVFVGAGLQSALAVLALAAQRPGAKLAIVEQSAVALGNHTWCFHAGDVPSAARAWLEPAVAQRWPRYRVRFPSFERVLPQPYAALTVRSLQAALMRALERLDARLLFGRRACALSAHAVELDDGARLEASLVLDARGPEAAQVAAVGYQKFLGLELSLRRPLAGEQLHEPVVMDAAVEQHDGFRFVYVLPLAADRVLVEETYYARSPRLDRELLSRRALAYAHELGLDVAHIARSEHGVLPLPGRVPLAETPPHEALRVGYGGGWFHPVTGYSFPVAVRLALHLAAHAPEAARGHALAALLAAEQRQARFLVLLNRLLFGAASDRARRNVLERFYRLPAPSIARFYAMALTPSDRARIMCGRPPRGLSLPSALAHALSTPTLRPS